MISRRTSARLVFICNLFVLPFRLLEWYQATDDDDEPIPLDPRWLVAGMGYRIVYNWAYDHDYGGIRTSLWRRTRLAVPEFIFGLLLASRRVPLSETARYNFLMGFQIGRIGYRLWYGILRPLPGTDE